MKIAILSDVLISSGGGLHMALTSFSTFKKLNIKDVEISYIVTNKELKKILEKELNIKTLLFDKKKLTNRILTNLNKFNLIKYLNIKFKKKNIFEKFLIENNIDLVFFLSPSSLVLLCQNVNFIYTIWEFQHKLTPFFPEYKSNYVDSKETINEFAIKKAFKIVTANNTDKNNFSKIYNVDLDRLHTLMFPPFISKDEKKISNIELDKFIKNKKFVFYPAQYWSHKNHRYIVDAFKRIEDEFYCIFTGINKGNMNFIKEYILKNKLSEKIKVYDYLHDSEIRYLYKNCYAVLFPSYVGSHSFPLFEGFYFDKPVIYNKDTIDKDLEDKVFLLDINREENLGEILKYIKNNKSLVDKKILLAKEHYKVFFDENNIAKKVADIINDYKKFSEKWSN